MKLLPAFSLTPSTIAWLMLLGLTTITFELGSRAPSPVLMAMVLTLTLVKGQLVVNYFMGLRRARLLWRLVMAGYLAVIGSVIALAYLSA
jgi:cytochrome c oxidase subunit IV